MKFFLFLYASLLFSSCTTPLHNPTSNTQRVISNAYNEKFMKLNKKFQYYKKEGNYGEALVYQKKLTFLTKEYVGLKDIVLADMYNNLALIHQDNGDYEEAIKYNLKSLAIKLEYYPIEYDAISTNYENMSSVYYTKREYALAIKYLKKSLSIRKKYFPKYSPDLADSYNNLGVLFQSISNKKEALFYLKKALLIHKRNKGEFSEKSASIYSSMGSLYEERGVYKQALMYHQKSLNILEKNVRNKEKSETLFSAYAGMAIFFHKLHRYDLSIYYHEKSLKIQKNITSTESLKTAQVYNNLGVVYMMRKSFDKSKEYLKKAITIKKKLLGERAALLTEEYENLGWLYFNTKEHNKAFLYAKKSMDIFLIQRDSYFPILNALESEHFMKNSEEKINLLFQIAYVLGDKKSYEESFSYWLQYKGALFENENTIQRLYQKTKNENIKKDIEKFLKHKRKLARLYQKKGGDSTLKFIKEEENKISYLMQKLTLNKENNTMNFSTLVSKLTVTELYIDFAKIGEHYFAFAVNSKSEIFFRRISKQHSKEINKLIVYFRKDIRATGADALLVSKVRLARLYDVLLKTLLEKLSKEQSNLIISPSSLLSRLPFEALYMKDKSRYLIEEKNIRYISSAKEFLQGQNKRTNESSSHIIVFSNPDFNTKITSSVRGGEERLFSLYFSNLEGTKEEARLIKKIMGSKNVIEYKGLQANEENFLKIKQPKILHVATHGFLIKQELSNPMLSAGIALSGANFSLKDGRGEGVITALKLSGLDLEGTELVVLSACETALVGLNSVDSVSVLSKAFIQAGASSIVASLWSVSDEGTKDLMQLFYEKVEKNNSYGLALKKAKIEMIKKNISPLIWASFILHSAKNE